MRPKARSLNKDEQDQVLAKLGAAINCSPVLTAFLVRVQCLRSRFYLDWCWDPDNHPDQWSTHGRITPLGNQSGHFLLEVQHGRNSWSEFATGTPEKLIQVVASDRKGTFLGLGSLDQSLRRTAKVGLTTLPVKQVSDAEFAFADTGKRCTVQQTLHYYFGLPIHIIAQPAGWYSCHRTPRIVEFSDDKMRVLVRFTAVSWSGESFGGTCLYANRNGRWGAYVIKPNQSENIATAEAWLIRRKWESW
jgi:hypothetical protein